MIGVIYDVNNMAKDGFETFRIGMELLGPHLQLVRGAGTSPANPMGGDRHWSYDGCDLAEHPRHSGPRRSQRRGLPGLL